MTLKIGRLGFVGLGIESTPGTAVPSTTTVPFMTNTIMGKHEYQGDIAARASRAQNFTSVIGKQWGEGEIDVNVDSLNAGYFLKLALGNEIVNTIQAGVYDHLFYTTTSGNNPTTATLYSYQGVDVQQFASMAVDKLDIDIKDEFMVMKAGFKGFFPSSGSHTPVTVSGTLFNFAKYQIQLGSTLIGAAAASATPVTEFQASVKNNMEVVFESGQSRATRVFSKELVIDGQFTMFFESVTERDNYLNLTKRSLILTASGIALPGGYSELLTINLAKLAYKDQSIETGLDNYFAIKTTFEAEVDISQGKQMDIVLRNYKSSVYA